MRVDLLTREYPPDIYGGAGVHAARLSEVLRATDGPQTPFDLRIRCFGQERDEPGVSAYAEPADVAGANAALRVLATDVRMAADVAGADVVHSHTWYTGMAGHLASLLHGIPHVVTAHSLEPLRPWKVEQLGGGYALSSWAERTAFEAAAGVIAVSDAMREDILRSYPGIEPGRVHVVPNGVDTQVWAPAADTGALARLGIDPDLPTVVFVGRITRQKGLPHLLRAAASLPRDSQLVLCAGQPDTEELGAEVVQLVEALRTGDAGPRQVVWIEQMLPREDLMQVLTAATVFCCPSVYEPQGIVNLEAMACGTAVVGTDTGGIPEVVRHRETGLIVPIEQLDDGTGTPLDADRFAADLAASLTEVLTSPQLATELGRAGRTRAVEHYSWTSIAGRTREVYDAVLAASGRRP